MVYKKQQESLERRRMMEASTRATPTNDDRKPRCLFEKTIHGRDANDRPVSVIVRCLRVEEHHGNHQFDTEIPKNRT